MRAKRLEGLKFRRQHPVGNFIVDFICLDKRLVIELDGGQHAEHAEPDTEKYDRQRDAWLEKEGYKVLLFWDNEVLLNSKGVLAEIRESCKENPPLNPLPSREGNIHEERKQSGDCSKSREGN
jgi:very-short-patch-repair endonuclease